MPSIIMAIAEASGESGFVIAPVSKLKAVCVQRDFENYLSDRQSIIKNVNQGERIARCVI